MLDGPFVLVDIDTQRDFLEPWGALYVPGSETILPRLERLTRLARSRGLSILATACAHSPEDEELRRFAPHCLVGSPGQERAAVTDYPDSLVLRADERWEGERLPLHLTIQKRELDVFSHPDADRLVALYNRDKPMFVVYGVTTDYCVRCAVNGLLERRCRVAVVVDAVRAIDAAREPEVLTGFARRGALLTLTEIVCEDE